MLYGHVLELINPHHSVGSVLQILTSTQFAAALVYAYPFIPRHKRWPEVLAIQQGEPSVQQLVNDGTLSDEQHAANWDVMVRHLSCLTTEQKEEYVPLPR